MVQRSSAAVKKPGKDGSALPRNPRGRRWTGRAIAGLRLAIALLGLAVLSGARGDDAGPSPRIPTPIEIEQDPRRISPDVRVHVEFASEKRQFAPLEPIPLVVSVRNNAEDREIRSRLIGRPPESDYRLFSIKVFDGNGEPVPATRFAEDDLLAAGLGRPGDQDEVRIGPGQRHEYTLTANLVRDMTSPDEYTILVEYPTLWETRIDGKTVAIVGQSHPITVRVLADPRREPPFWNRPKRAKFDELKQALEASREQDRQTPPQEPIDHRNIKKE
jgi:hypothetical protein